MDDKLVPARLRKHWIRRNWVTLALGLVIAGHLALVVYFERPSAVFTATPNSWLDFDTHLEQTWRVTEAIEKYGKTWAYDVQLLAGIPVGTIFDADNKGWELLTYGLWKLGLPKGLAFNIYIILASVMVPFVVFGSARLFGLGRGATLFAVTSASILWFFDSYARWISWVGMTAYGIAGYFFLLPLGLFYRYLESRKWRYIPLLALALALGHLNHPYSFVILATSMLILYGMNFKSLSPVQHLAIVSCALFTVAVNAYWLVPAFQFWHYILNSAFYAQSTLSFFLTDYLGLINEPLVTGVLSSRTGFRFIVFFAGVFGLALWWKEDRKRFWTFSVGLGFMLLVTYLGGYSLFLSQIQPYRHALPAMFFTVIPAAVFAERVWGSRELFSLKRSTYALLSLGLLVTVQNVSRDVIYYFPSLLPDADLRQEEKVALQELNPQVAMITKPHLEVRHQPTFKDYDEVVQWIRDNDDGQGRILVEWWILGEHLAWRTDGQILGGFLERNLEHAAANLFRRLAEREVDQKEIQKYFEDYAVKWVILSRPNVAIEKYRGTLLEPLAFIPPVHRIYKTKSPPSYFAEGDGRVEASMNHLRVTGTDPNVDLVLRFHWLDQFRCVEGCTLVREPIENDSVGFIRVKAPHPADFNIVNKY